MLLADGASLASAVNSSRDFLTFWLSRFFFTSSTASTLCFSMAGLDR